MESQELHDDRVSQVPPIRPMVWGFAETRAAFEEEWVQRIGLHDPWGLQCGKRDIWLYLLMKLAELIRRGNHIGPAAWLFQARQVGHLRYGYVWGHGGHEQEDELPSGSAADIMAAGSQWWPVIWVDVGGGWLVPVYCPGLAWANARPWMAHCTRIREVETPAIVHKLDPDCGIMQVLEVA